MVLPIMDYPPIPTHALSKSRLETLQNRTLRQTYNDTSYPPRFNSEKKLHRKAKSKSINERLNQSANNVRNKIQRMSHPIFPNLIGREMQIREEHRYYFPRTKLDQPLLRH